MNFIKIENFLIIIEIFSIIIKKFEHIHLIFPFYNYECLRFYQLY